MRRLILALLLASSPVLAQAPDSDVNLSWQASAMASGYKTYWGTTTGTYPNVQDVGDVLTYSYAHDSMPRDCTPLFAAVTAYNAAGESGYSDEVTFYARPLIDADDGIGPTANETVWYINGTSFAPGITLKINGALVDSVNRDSCTNLTFLVADVPGAATWNSIELCNGTVCSDALPKPKAPGAAPVAN